MSLAALPRVDGAGAAPLAPAVTHRKFWPLPLLTVATTLIAIGGVWDISWHLTVGRDTFWTAAHLAIYLGGAGGGIVCGLLAVQSTFFSSPAERTGEIRLLGATAPFGAWIGIWGAGAMLVSAPFDNWWHAAYGLDVKIISPPHILLFLGMLTLRLGAWMLILREQNRTPAPGAPSYLFSWVGGLAMGGMIGIFLVEIWPNRQHNGAYYQLMSAVIPFFLAAVSRATKLRWGTTLAAASHMLLSASMTWILPRFAASPHLGPIYNPLTHMAPPPFPQWTILPAVAFDLLRPHLKGGRDWLGAPLFAATFLVLFIPTQWRFSTFYVSPAADNGFWHGGGQNFGYNNPPGPHWFEFWGAEDGLSLTASLLPSLLIASVAVFAGLRFGQWMTRVRR